MPLTGLQCVDCVLVYQMQRASSFMAAEIKRLKTLKFNTIVSDKKAAEAALDQREIRDKRAD